MAASTNIERDANLDALKSAVMDWAAKEKSRIENETKFLRTVLQGRGVTDAASLNLLSASASLGDEIDNFLSVG